MDKILNLDSVDQYNSLYGLETLNPLVSVIAVSYTHLCVFSRSVNTPISLSPLIKAESNASQ